jgi:polar amino acid transport system substrate-binding protein
MQRVIIVLASLVLLGGCATGPAPAPLAKFDLAPSGKLRVGIDFGNVLLAGKDAKTGEPRGVAVDLARALARRLDVPIEIVAFDSAGAMADAVKHGKWDVAFLGAEPQRANEIAFSAAYAEIESTYLPAGSPLRVQQAIGTPKARDAAARYLREFVEDAKASGLVARTIELNAVRGLTVAPPASAR